MSLVRSISQEEDGTDTLKYYKNKVVIAKIILRVLKTRLYLIKATEKQVPHKVLSDMTKLECGLSEAIRMLQKEAFKKKMINVALERGILSSLLSVANTDFMGPSSNLNNIEKFIAKQLVLMLDQSEKIKKLCGVESDHFDEIVAERSEVSTLHGAMKEKLNALQLRTPNVKKENEDEKTLKEIKASVDKINMLSMLMSVFVCNEETSTEVKKQFLPVVVKWSERRSVAYYKTKLGLET